MMQRLIPIVLVVIAIGLFLGYINPTYNDTIIPLQEQLGRYDSALAAAETFKMREEELTQQRNAIPAASLARLEAFLPDSVNNVQLILDLNALAERSGMKITGFNVTDSATGGKVGATVQDLPLTSGKPVDSITIAIAGTGSYDAFRTYIAAVEKSLRPLDVVEMTVSDSPTGVYTYQVAFRIYWLH